MAIEKIIRKRKNLIDYLEDAESDEEVEDIKARRKRYDNEISDSKNRINQIRDKIDICKSNITQHLNSSLTSDIISSIESNRNKMKIQIKEFIKKIIPYPIANSHSVLEVHTIFGLYYILYSSRDKDKQAYYLYGSYYKFFPKDNKFLVIGDMDEDLIEKNMQVSKFAQSLTINNMSIPREIKISGNNIELSDAQKINRKYYQITDSTGVYTYEEMKEKCKKMNWILPFTI